MTWKRFSHHCPFGGGIHRSLVASIPESHSNVGYFFAVILWNQQSNADYLRRPDNAIVVGSYRDCQGEPAVCGSTPDISHHYICPLAADAEWWQMYWDILSVITELTEYGALKFCITIDL